MTFKIAEPQFSGSLPGTFKGQLTRTEIVSTQFGDSRKWFFLVDVGDGKPAEEVSFLTSMNTGSGSKTYQWLTALIGREPKAGETLEDPTGKTIILQLDKNEKGFPKVVALLPHEQPLQMEPGIPR